MSAAFAVVVFSWGFGQWAAWELPLLQLLIYFIIIIFLCNAKIHFLQRRTNMNGQSREPNMCHYIFTMHNNNLSLGVVVVIVVVVGIAC